MEAAKKVDALKEEGLANLNIGLLGLGTVGTGVVKVIRRHAEDLERQIGVPIAVTNVLVRDLRKQRKLELEGIALTDQVNNILHNPEIDIVVELLGGEFPAKEYILEAIKNGKHVVTANKDVMAKHGKEIFTLAKAHGVEILFEASVGGGIPIIMPLKQSLVANKIEEILGIVNGTTNYILTKMAKEKKDLREALAEAQAFGYAENDPTADVEGYDAARKIAILASIAFQTRVGFEDVYTEGIKEISPSDIAYADELGFVIKLLAVAKSVDDEVEVRVHPAFIPKEHPLASVNDVYNAIFVRGDVVGETMFYGKGAGELPTASAVVGDIVEIAKTIVNKQKARFGCTCYFKSKIRDIGLITTKYYLRLIVLDRAGVFAAIAGVFAQNQVSLDSVIQKRVIGDTAEIVIVTHEVQESNIQAAIAKLKQLPVVKKVYPAIRVEGENSSKEGREIR